MRANIHLNPQMPFYPKDFLTHTAFLTDSQAIRYLWALCNMYIHGRLTEKQMILVCKGYDKEVFDMFSRDEDGRYYDEKLEYEIMKRDEFQLKTTARKQGSRQGGIRIVQVTKREERPEEKKSAYGKGKNVFLTDREYRDLKDTFGEETEDRIEDLSLYMLSKGRSYESHYATIKKWELDRKREKDEEKYKPRDYGDFKKMAMKYD